MSCAAKCNRCGTYYDPINVQIHYSGRMPADWSEKDYDLCPECAKEFEEFMQGAKATTLRERLMNRIKRKE